MKFIYTFTLAFFLSFPLAAEEGATKSTERDVGLLKDLEPGANMVTKFDKNGDGQLTGDERKEWEDQVLSKWDKNKDGKLDEKEMEEWNAVKQKNAAAARKKK